MRTWRTATDKCYLCGIKDNQQYPFTLEEKDDKGNAISREVASSARLIEVIRRFDKDNEVVFYICTRCELLTVLDPEREFFRFAFPEEKLKPFKTLDLIKWANDITAKTQAQDSQITNLTKDLAKLRADKEAPKENGLLKETTIDTELGKDTTVTDATPPTTPTKTEEEKKDE